MRNLSKADMVDSGHMLLDQQNAVHCSLQSGHLNKVDSFYSTNGVCFRDYINKVTSKNKYSFQKGA